MPNLPISQLPAVTAVADADLAVVVQSGVTKKSTVAQLQATPIALAAAAVATANNALTAVSALQQVPTVGLASALNFLRVNGSGTAYEFVPPLNVPAAIGAVDLLNAQTIAGLKTFSTTPKFPTAAPGDNSTNGASTAFVTGAVGSLKAPSNRQTVLTGVVNAAGYPAMLGAGTGLNLNFLATAQPMVTAYANGQGDLISTLSADVIGLMAVPAYHLSYLTQDFVSAASVTWGFTSAPLQDGSAYDRTKQAVLQLSGAAGTTAFPDDFGNAWTANGSAKIQINSIKYGTGALGGGGAANIMNGTTDWISSTAFTRLGTDGWSMRCWANPSAIGVGHCLMACVNAAGFGLRVTMSTAGKLVYDLSSNGTSNDIGSATGSATMVAGTYQFVEVTRDKVTGNYYAMVGGSVDSLIATNAAEICGTTAAYFGTVPGAGSGSWLGYIDKPEILPYCQNPGGVNYTPPPAAPNVATQGYASDWYNTSNTTLNQVSGPSTAVNTPPVFTAKNRMYVGEASAGATTITSVVNYAFKGKFYQRTPTIQSVSSRILQANNIGSDKIKIAVNLINRTGEFGYLPGQKVQLQSFQNGSGPAVLSSTQILDRNTSAIALNAAGSVIQTVASGPTTYVTPTGISWDTEVIIEKV